MHLGVPCPWRSALAEGCKNEPQHAGVRSCISESVLHLSPEVCTCRRLPKRTAARGLSHELFTLRGVCPCGNGKCKDFAATPVVACVQMGEASKTRNATTKARRSTTAEGVQFLPACCTQAPSVSMEITLCFAIFWPTHRPAPSIYQGEKEAALLVPWRRQPANSSCSCA